MVGLVLGSFAVMGFFTLPLLPAVIENAVEATFPIPEEVLSRSVSGDETDMFL